MSDRTTYAQGSEEPPVLAALVALLKELLDRLLGLLTLRHLLERVRRDGALQALELQSVTGGEQVVVVDDLTLISMSTYLDERLDLAAASELLGAHRLGHLERVALNTGGNHEGKAVLLVALVVLLDHDDLTVSLSCSMRRHSLAWRAAPGAEPTFLPACRPWRTTLSCVSSYSTRMIRTQPYRACRS